MTLFNTRYGESYYSFELNNDLFIVSDGNLDGWRITGDQLNFLETTITTNKDLTQKVFIFVHQVIFPVNYHSEEGLILPLNFKTEVLPMLEETHKKIYLFAGDVGAFDWGTSVIYDEKENVTYISSGMGGGVHDNFLIVDVYDNNSLGFRLISLNGDDIHALGKLTNYLF